MSYGGWGCLGYGGWGCRTDLFGFGLLGFDVFGFGLCGFGLFGFGLALFGMGFVVPGRSCSSSPICTPRLRGIEGACEGEGVSE